ncbi:NusG domain II-containing protein [Butyrivibrio sp. MB2005]|uniref:NusG domain II-containing protein n=1 Tax=Butyrivibrio sp. MB2005 TaxID=1280678 RepID=UPI0004791A05|nr:NusG domain II-containing protein [Butyrivibrio sp. MB2005]
MIMGGENQKKNTYILLLAVCIIAVCIFVANKALAKTGDYAEVSVDGETVYELPLSENTELLITGTDGGTNKLIINNGVCYVTEADCPDKLCIKQGKISHNGESIICLPHKLVITIHNSSDTSSNVDAITK